MRKYRRDSQWTLCSASQSRGTTHLTVRTHVWFAGHTLAGSPSCSHPHEPARGSAPPRALAPPTRTRPHRSLPAPLRPAPRARVAPPYILWSPATAPTTRHFMCNCGLDGRGERGRRRGNVCERRARLSGRGTWGHPQAAAQLLDDPVVGNGLTDDLGGRGAIGRNVRFGLGKGQMRLGIGDSALQNRPPHLLWSRDGAPQERARVGCMRLTNFRALSF